MSLFNRNGSDKAGDPPARPSLPQTLQSQTPPAESAASRPPSSPAPIPQTSQPSAKTGAHMSSVISKALKITGQLESTEDIQIDGEIDGDVRGVGVKIGQNAKVKGTVYGEDVELAGAIEGKIEAKKVLLTGTARMTGDVV